MPATYEPIASQTLGSAASTVTFSSISGAFTDLVLIANVGMSSNASYQVRVNGDTGNNYSWTRVSGNGSAAGSSRDSNVASINTVIQGFPDLVLGKFEFLSYANTNVFKTMLFGGGAASDVVTRTVGLWRNTAAITSITVFTGTSFNTGATFSLFGLKAA
jgi:hypothetical protein